MIPRLPRENVWSQIPIHLRSFPDHREKKANETTVLFQELTGGDPNGHAISVMNMDQVQRRPETQTGHGSDTNGRSSRRGGRVGENSFAMTIAQRGWPHDATRAMRQEEWAEMPSTIRHPRLLPPNVPDSVEQLQPLISAVSRIPNRIMRNQVPFIFVDG